VTARRAELLVGLAAGAFGAASASIEGVGAVGVVSGAVVGGALGAGRGHPRAAWLVAVAALLTGAPFGVSVGVALLVVAHAFCAGRWERRGAGLIALAALVGALELAVSLAHDSGQVPAVLLPAACWGAARALRERELVATRLAERARELQEEREAHAALSARYERARIASELHDIVAHAISVMVIQASAGQRLATRDPDATAETFKAIAAAAREADQDMQRLVALLGDENAIVAAPDLALVETLVARAASSGLAVTLHMAGDLAQLPTPIAQTAYHVVQEGLTNALRYASGATVRIRLDGGPEALIVEVTNAPARGEAALVGAGTHTGLQGLRERVGACGGVFQAGPTADGGWRLSARLPRRVAAPAGRPH
jgi:signal transduction histidine kinase